MPLSLHSTVSQNERRNRDYLFLIFPVSLFTIVMTGYRFAVGDQVAYIPIIWRIRDPSLYPGDYFFRQSGNKSTIMLPIVAYLSKLFPLEWVFFIGYLACIIGLFWAIYALAFSLFGNRDVAWIAVLLLSGISRRPDYAITTQETFFRPQPVAMPFCLMTLSFFVEGRYIRAAIWNAIAFLLHPIAAMPVFLVLSGYLILNTRRLGWQMVLKALGAFFIITGPFLIITAGSMSNNFSTGGMFKVASKEWMDIQYQRNEYTFPVLWDRGSWRHLLSILALFVVSMFLKKMLAGKDGKDQKALWIVAMSLMSLGVAHVFGSVIPLPLIFQFHLYRGLYMLMYIAFVYAAFVIWTEYQQHRFTPDTAAIIIVSAAAMATGDDVLPVLAILTCLLLWVRTATSVGVFNGALRVLGLMVCAYISFRASRDLLLLAMIAAPLFLFLTLRLLKTPNAMEGRSLSRFVSLGLVLIVVVPAIISGSSRNLVLLAMISAPLFLFLTLVLLRTPNTMEWRSLNRFVSLGLLLIVVVTAKIYKNGPQIAFPFFTLNDSWSQVQYWAAAHTPKTAVFMVPPDTQGFRNFSQRTIVGDQKDGGANSYSESYAKEWARRMSELEFYDSFRDTDFTRLAKEYNASFVVTTRGRQILSFPKVYENDDFYVYKIPEQR